MKKQFLTANFFLVFFCLFAETSEFHTYNFNNSGSWNFAITLDTKWNMDMKFADQIG